MGGQGLEDRLPSPGGSLFAYLPNDTGMAGPGLNGKGTEQQGYVHSGP